MRRIIWITLGIIMVGCTQQKEDEIAPITSTIPEVRNSDWVFVVRNFDQESGNSYVKYGAATQDDPNMPEFTHRYNGIQETTNDQSPQGESYYYLSGESKDSVYYFGGAEFYFDFPWKDEDPNNIYFNVYVKGDDQLNSRVDFYLPYKSFLNTHVNWEGWKLLSIRMSDIGITSMKEINQISIGVGTELKEKTGSAKFDYLTFTKGKPLSEK